MLDKKESCNRKNKQRSSKALAALLFVVLTGLLFGCMETVCKFAGGSLDPFQITFLRFAIGSIFMFPFALHSYRKAGLKLHLKDHIWLAFLGVLCVPVSMMLFQFGVNYSNASTMAVVFSANPLFTMLIAHIFTDEKMNRVMSVAFIITLVGVVLMIRPWNIQEGNSVIGFVFTIIAAISFSAYTVIGKATISKYGNTVQTFMAFVYGTIILFIVMLIMHKPVFEGAVEHWYLLIFLGIAVTGIGYLSYFQAIKLANATTGSVAFLIKAAFAPVFAIMVLGETVLPTSWIGIAVILCASIIVFRENSKHMKMADEKLDLKVAKAEAGLEHGIEMAESIAEKKYAKIKELITQRERGIIGQKRLFAVLIPLVKLPGDDKLYLLFETRANDMDQQPGEVCFPGGKREKGESYQKCAVRETMEEIGLEKSAIEVMGRFDTYSSDLGAVLASFVSRVTLPDGITLTEMKDAADPATSSDAKNATGAGADVQELTEDKNDIYKGWYVEGLDLNDREVDNVFLVPVRYFMDVEPDSYELGLIPDVPDDFPYEKITGNKKSEGYEWKMGTHHVPAYYFHDRVIWGITGRITQSFANVLKRSES